MNPMKQILYLYAETPVHVGTGVGLGAVDMPIQREKHTGYPIAQASGVKGALRDTAELHWRDSEEGKARIVSIFGGASGSEDETHAGAMSPSDARILLFPVRALSGVFLWITSPTVLERFKQESRLEDGPTVARLENNDPVQVASNERIVGGQIMLEEYAYAAQVSPVAQEWATYLADHALHPSTGKFWKQRLTTHLAIVPDDEFRDFVRYSTDIVTRIHIDDVKKTVKDGQLFTQELLPADSLLYSLVHVTGSRDEKLTSQDVVGYLLEAIGDRLQIGGDETVGRGRVRLNWQGVE